MNSKKVKGTEQVDSSVYTSDVFWRNSVQTLT